MQFDDFCCIEKGSKVFFTMATLLMPLLENVVSCPTRTKNLEQSLTNTHYRVKKDPQYLQRGVNLCDVACLNYALLGFFWLYL